MVVIRRLGADILPGDFLLAHRQHIPSPSLAVCRLKNVMIAEQLEVVWWVSPIVATPLCPETFENLHKCRGREVCPSTSSVICHDDVFEIAFVFSAIILEELWVDFAGMTHVFFTRHENHNPFSSLVVESYPSRIWYTILGLQERIKKMMSYK
jgi:hypothetical protein